MRDEEVIGTSESLWRSKWSNVNVSIILIEFKYFNRISDPPTNYILTLVNALTSVPPLYWPHDTRVAYEI